MRRDPEALKAALADLEQAQLKRVRRVLPPDGPLNFCSNDYLGLARHPELVSAFCEAAAKHGVGSGASHLVTGHSSLHSALEDEIAAFTGRQKALFFSTGYMANMGVIGALADQNAVIVADKLNHASLIDGCRLSRAEFKRYPHRAVERARELLAEHSPPTPQAALLVTDGVFSMDGDIAPLPELARIAHESQAWLIVDDAHGLGVLGRTGRGSCEHFGLDASDVPLLVGTFGKAFGTCGAFVAGDAEVIDYVLQKARTYIYTTALPPAVAAATLAALRVSQREPWRREKCLALALRFRQGLASEHLGSAVGSDVTPIVPVVLGSAARALAASSALEKQGFLVMAIRSPTVPAGTERLRVTFSAEHSEQQVDALLGALNAFLETRGECAT